MSENSKMTRPNINDRRASKTTNIVAILTVISAISYSYLVRDNKLPPWANTKPGKTVEQENAYPLYCTQDYLRIVWDEFCKSKTTHTRYDTRNQSRATFRRFVPPTLWTDPFASREQSLAAPSPTAPVSLALH